MNSVKNFLRWYNNKDVAPFLRAMQIKVYSLPKQKHRSVKVWL